MSDLENILKALRLNFQIKTKDDLQNLKSEFWKKWLNLVTI